jgi:prepilin-type N-terminal cleavage/methylation domain-containing protein
MKPHTHTRRCHKAGFTVIELMVTVSIVVLVTGIIMLQYSSFNSSVLLRSQAYLTGFDVREAQSLAVGIRGRGSEFREEYGIYFSLASPNTYLLFQDNDSLGEHTPVRYNQGEEVGVPYTVDPRFRLVNICATNATGRACAYDDPSTTNESIDASLQEMTISYRRPDFDAAFYSPSRSNITAVDIIIAADQSAQIQRKVVVYSTGQVSVQ